MKNKLFVLLIVLTFLVAVPVHAKEVNDFHAVASDNVKFEDTVNGDSAIAGNIVDVLGNIDGIGFIAGSDVNVNGKLEYGFVAGKNVKIDGSILKNIYAAGQTIDVSKNANVNRDTFLAAQYVNLNGNLNRNVRIGANSVVIENGTTIKGNINISADSITIKDGVKILGTLKYNDNAKKDISKNASIGKVVTYKASQDNSSSFNTSKTVLSIINMLVVFIVIAFIIPKAVTKTTDIYNSKNPHYLKSIGIGLIILICTPIVAILLLISNVGTNLGLILSALYAITLYLSFIVSGFILGYLIFAKLLKANINNILIGIIGIILLKVLILIPYVGFIVSLLGITIGLATIYNLLKCEEKKTNKESSVIEASVKPKTKKNVSK